MKHKKLNLLMKVILVLVLLIFMLSLSNALPQPAAEFYGSVIFNNGTNVSVGTSITAYDPDGNLCGYFIVINTGYYGLLSCNGDDPDTEEDEGAESGDEITFYVNNAFGVHSENISWSPGAYFEVNLTGNNPPVLTPIGPKTAIEGELYGYTVRATDPDNDVLTFSTNSTLFTINSTTGVISFTPTISQIGNHSINISVSDGYYVVFEIINFTVVRGSYCGDNVCNPNEDCFTCLEDCGECPDIDGDAGKSVEGAGVEGAGVEGVSAESEEEDTPEETVYYSCSERWKCTEWAKCTQTGIQRRNCTDLNNCGTSKERPKEAQKCEYIPTCFDGILNIDETDIDCGGSCDPCEDSKKCILNSDCKSDYCDPSGVCSVPTCFDGFQNQGEEDVDCGGPCEACEIKKYAKLPSAEQVLKFEKIKEFPWILIIIISILISTVLAGDKGYVSYIMKKDIKEYRKKYNKYRSIRRKIHIFIINIFVITIIISTYIYMFSDCLKCMRRYNWVMLSFLFATPFLVSMIIRHYEYYEYRRKKEEKKAMNAHKKNVRGLIEVENKLISETEKKIRLNIYNSMKEKRFEGYPELYNEFREIYKELKELSKNEEKIKEFEKNKEVRGKISRLIENKNLKKESKKYAEFKSVLNYLKDLKGKNGVDIEKELVEDIKEISKPHIKSVIIAEPTLIGMYNALVDLYEYFNNKHDSLKKEEKNIMENEKYFLNKLNEMSGRAEAMKNINENQEFIKIYNKMVDLYNNINRKHELYEKDLQRKIIMKRKIE